MDADVTTIIRTIGRPTLSNSIASSLREGFSVIVVGDAIPMSSFDELKTQFPYQFVNFYTCGIKWGCYGYQCVNLGALIASTKYIQILDDDDEFNVGAGNFILKNINEKPEIDIWIPALRYNDGGGAAFGKREIVEVCNVACPTYKTEVIIRNPFKVKYPCDNCVSDFFHVKECQECGYKIGWYKKQLILVRPKLQGKSGHGEI